MLPIFSMRALVVDVADAIPRHDVDAIRVAHCESSGGCYAFDDADGAIPFSRHSVEALVADALSWLVKAETPNHALQRTAGVRLGFNHGVLAQPSLSLGR